MKDNKLNMTDSVYKNYRKHYILLFIIAHSMLLEIMIFFTKFIKKNISSSKERDLTLPLDATIFGQLNKLFYVWPFVVKEHRKERKS